MSSLASDIQYAPSSQMEELQLFPLEIIRTLIFSAVSYFLGLLFILLMWFFFFHPHLYFCPSYPRRLAQMSLYWDNSKPCPGFVRCPKQMKISQLSQENKFPFCLQLPLGVKECSEHTLKPKILTASSCPLCASVALCLLSVCVWPGGGLVCDLAPPQKRKNGTCKKNNFQKRRDRRELTLTRPPVCVCVSCIEVESVYQFWIWSCLIPLLTDCCVALVAHQSVNPNGENPDKSWQMKMSVQLTATHRE